MSNVNVTHPTDELRAAVAVLRDMPGAMPGAVRGVIVTREDDAYADEHTVVVCADGHDKIPPNLLDRHGCCPGCEYIRSHDQELSAAAAVLLTVPGPLARLLGHVADDMAKQEAVEGSVSRAVHPACALGLAAPRGDWTAALAVARAVNAATDHKHDDTATSERNEQ